MKINSFDSRVCPSASLRRAGPSRDSIDSGLELFDKPRLVERQVEWRRFLPPIQKSGWTPPNVSNDSWVFAGLGNEVAGNEVAFPLI